MTVQNEDAATADQPSGETLVDRTWATLVETLDGRMLPVPTGFLTIDRALAGGLQRGTLTVVAGSSGSGTTTLGMGMALRAAVDDGLPVSIVVLDQRPEDMMVRALCARGRIARRKLLGGVLADEDRFRLAEAGAALRESGLEIVRPDVLDGPGALARIRSEVIVRGAQLVVVDGADLTAGRDLSRPEFSEFLRDAKAVVAGTGAALVVTVRLPMGPTQAYLRGMPTPLHETGPTADFIDLGPVGHVADAVLLINRPDRWDADDYRAGETDLVLVKNPVGTPTQTTVAHQLHLCRFIDMMRG